MPAYHNPTPTVDVIIELPANRIVLVERRTPPPGWALPGGFVDEGEPLWRAATREVLEETGLHVELLEQFHTYSAPGRDPRQHTVSTVFIGRATGTPQAGDDAQNVAIFEAGRWPDLAFDHGEILADYLVYRETGRRPAPDR
ncbi:MAG: NUDIX hydrolase [bacterium]